MKRIWGNVVGIVVLAVPSVRWILDIIGLASLPEDLGAWGIVVKTMLDEPWITIPAFLGIAIIAFTNIPALRFWEKDGAVSWIEGKKIPPKFIPLSEAARIAYEEMRGHDYGLVAEKMTNSPDEILTYCAHALLTGEDGIPLYGSKPPSRKTELIPRDTVNSWHFSDSCNDLVLLGDREPVFIDLRVPSDKLYARIQDMKKMSLT